jgi:hypothetical protein
MEPEKNFNETAETVSLSSKEIEVIAEKSGYSPATVAGVLRGYIPRLKRHQKLFELYHKMNHLRELHHENYLKDLEEL